MRARRLLAASVLLVATGAATLLPGLASEAGAVTVSPDHGSSPAPTAAATRANRPSSNGELLGLPTSLPVALTLGPVSARVTVPLTVPGLVGSGAGARGGSATTGTTTAPAGSTGSGHGASGSRAAGHRDSIGSADHRGTRQPRGRAVSRHADVVRGTTLAQTGTLTRLHRDAVARADRQHKQALALGRALLPHPGPFLLIALVAVCAAGVALLALVSGRWNRRRTPRPATTQARRPKPVR